MLKKMIFAAMVSLLLLPSAVMANPMQMQGDNVESQQMQRHNRQPHYFMQIHHQYYMQLLAEKYTPQQVGEWKQVFAERQKLMQQIHTLKSSNKWPAQKQQQLHESMARLHEEQKPLMQQFTSAVKQENAAEIKTMLPKLLAGQQKMNQTIQQSL